MKRDDERRKARAAKDRADYEARQERKRREEEARATAARLAAEAAERKAEEAEAWRQVEAARRREADRRWHEECPSGCPVCGDSPPVRLRPFFDGDRQTGWSVWAAGGIDVHIGTAPMLPRADLHRRALQMAKTHEVRERVDEELRRREGAPPRVVASIGNRGIPLALLLALAAAK